MKPFVLLLMRVLRPLAVALLGSAAAVGTAASSNMSRPAGAAEPPWQIQVVAPADSGGSSLVLDEWEHPHISYQAQTPGTRTLSYARWTGKQWVIDTVGSMDLGGSTMLALDQTGSPHIAYTACNPFTCELRYARRAAGPGGGWQIETIAPSISGVSLSLAIDRHNRPHLTYCDAQLEVRYQHWTGVQWERAALDPAGCWYSTALALDRLDRPHLGYFAAGPEDLKYAHWTGTTWDIHSIDQHGEVGRGIALQLDTDNRPALSYIDASNQTIKFAAWDGTRWHITTIDRTVVIGATTSLALDSTNGPHISYTDASGEGIKYATKTKGSWYIETVAPGYQPRMTLDSRQRPHLSFTNGGLHYAVRASPAAPRHIYLPWLGQESARQ